jgi:hypothetical protein
VKRVVGSADGPLFFARQKNAAIPAIRADVNFVLTTKLAVF